MIEFLSSRSRNEDWLRCPRARWWLHEAQGTGFEAVRVALPLAAGGSVHIGLASLLRTAMEHEDGRLIEFGDVSTDMAVKAALQDYEAKCSGRGLDLEALESQSFVFGEQKALVEALVRLAAMRVIPRLLETYEILEVERMDKEELIREEYVYASGLDPDEVLPWRVMWRSIPDALMRNRADGQLYLLSWKTCGEVPRDDQARVDMQGVSEAWATNTRLGRWNLAVQRGRLEGIPNWFLRARDETATMVRGVQMVYLVKGQRRDSGTEGRRLQGLDPAQEGKVYKTSSPLIYGYSDTSATGTPKFATSAEWPCAGVPHGGLRPSKYYPGGMCPGDKKYHKRGEEWQSFPVWTAMGVREWMEMLSRGEVSPEAGDPLESEWAMPVPNFRPAEHLWNWLEQTHAAERRIAEDLIQLRAEEARGEEFPHSLNSSVLGPQASEKCNSWFGRKCGAWDLCWGPEHIAADPVGSGLYQIKTPYSPVIADE